MNQSAQTAIESPVMADSPVENLQPRTVGLGNILRGVVEMLPNIGTTLKGVGALVTTKPHKTKSIGWLLEKQAAAQPNHVAIRYQNSAITYGEFNAQANRIAHYLTSIGIKSGDVVGVMLENRPETLISVLAIVKLGAVASMFNTSQRGDVLEHSIKLVKPKAIIVGEEMIDAIASVEHALSSELKQHLLYVKDQGTVGCPAHYQDLAEVSKTQSTQNLPVTATIKMHQPCYYIFTSGTTGLPKASVMSHYRWFKSMAGMGLASMRMRKDDVLYVSLPLYHNNALTVSLAAVLGAGACMAISRKFSVSRFWDEIRHHNATAFCYIGELCRYLLNTQPTDKDLEHKVRVIIGNGLRSDIWMEFKQRFGIKHINEFYGASECNLVFTNALNLDKTAGICPLPHNIVEYDIEADAPIRDKNGFMIPVQKGGVGLLITEINDKQPFDGYTDEEASNKKLFRNVFSQGDCWFNTGDLVLNQGFKHIAFADRLGDTFRWKGENVATTEIESVLMEVAEIEHAVVYGVEVPNADGRAGMAALTLRAGSHPDWSAVAAHLRAKLPAYSIPLFLRLREQEEITGTFKYRKVELKNEAFHLEQVTEPVLVLADKNGAYQPLTRALEDDIKAGRLTF